MLKIFKRMGRTEWGLLITGVLLVIGQVYSDLKVPDYMSAITRLVKTPGSRLSEIWLAGGLMLGCSLLSMGLTFLSGFVTARLAATFSRNLRSALFDAVESFSLEEIDRFTTSSLITRSTNDVAQIQNFISGGFTMMLRAPVTVGLALAKISAKHWQWTALTTGAVVVVLCVVAFIITYAHPRFRRLQALTDSLNQAMRENLTGIRVVRAYNAEAYQEEKFARANDRLTNNHLQAQRAMSVMHPVMRFLNNGLTVGIYCTGSFLIVQALGTTAAIDTFSDMVVFSTYASKILFAFMGLNFIFMQLPRASVCAARINELLDTVPSIQDGDAQEGREGLAGVLEFRHVSFRYPGTDEDMLHDISFTARQGETVALIGVTGSGKSTLVNLIPRFYDATAGEVLLDGRNVREYTQKALRGKLGYAPQQAVLFTGTVSSNIRYGEGPDHPDPEEAVRQAVEIAQAKSFVEAMEGGYDAAIARGGVNVSGGQKQRLSVARSVFRRPEVYLFDDTFSALDYKTDQTLRAALKRETAGATTLIVAQRIGTIRDADKIIVLDEGRVAGMGVHEDLMKSCELYREIAYTQLSEEELQ